MSILKNLCTRACIYTVIILTVFYGFVTIDQGTVASIPFTSFLSLFAIGTFIALSALLFKINRLPYILRVLLNFTVLLGSLFGIMISIGQLENKGPSVYIVVAFAFTVFYAAIFGLSRLIASKMSKINDKNQSKSKSGTKKAEYKPLYK